MSERRIWEVVDHDQYPSFKVLKGASFDVSVVMAATDLTFEDYIRRSDDLQLMAAAPALLEAVRKAEEWLSGWASAEPYLSEIRAAIFKATGQTRIQGEREVTKS